MPRSFIAGSEALHLEHCKAPANQAVDGPIGKSV